MSDAPATTTRYLCTAPPGGCGFRGRDWRKGSTPASYSPHDGTPFCACGSEMRAIGPRVKRARKVAP